MSHPDRIHRRSRDAEAVDGEYVLYWMQASQRAIGNHALEVAVQEAGRLKVPLLVGFGLTADYPEAQPRHYRFMLEGLKETAAALRERGIAFALRLGLPPQVALELAQQARLLVMDCGYLRHQRRWRDQLAGAAPCPVLEVEADVVIPAWKVSDKEEYAARTIRPKIHRLLDEHLIAVDPVEVSVAAGDMGPGSEDTDDVEALLERLHLKGDVDTTPHCPLGGPSVAYGKLGGFISGRLPHYHDRRSDPAEEWTSGLSPYLHFGQISPVDVAVAVRDAGGEGAEDFLEELIVRRELSINYVLHNPVYDTYDG
ncbi:MAG: deoxyribodipyrimidine photolyase, partial [Armatimonadia bacterium]|nr:deoxyribodipyrimidine photolyase [Armatimonadia bacterium]